MFQGPGSKSKPPHRGSSQILVLSTTLTTIAAGVTNYIGSNNGTPTEANVIIYIPFRCLARNFRMNAQSVPGAGQTFTYTLRKNQVDTAITCTTSGAGASGSNDLSNEVIYEPGDTLNIKIVTSAGAGVGVHWGSVELRPYS